MYLLIPWLFFLREDDQILIESFTHRQVVNGPGSYLGRPFQRIHMRKAITLEPAEYLLVRDRLSGELSNITGPQLYFPPASVEVVEKRLAIPLKPNEYIRLVDIQTGAVRVERGEQVVYLQPTEKALGEVEKGINIDEHTAVVVLDTTDGQRSLVTEHQVYIPGPTQQIAGVHKRVRLEDHETVVIKDRMGKYHIRRGIDSERSFFLDPYSELVTFSWSAGLHKDRRSLQITHIDMRPKFMWYEFEARTQDNVELVLGITFFWQILDVAAMLQATDDAPGDVCSHARSAIIQAVSQTPLEEFLASFNQIVRKAVLTSEDGFYAERGVRLQAVEVRSVSCKDTETQHILQEIIREATNRLNRLQKQESENDITLKQINGEINAEALRGQLLQARAANEETAARIAGDSEALRVRAFLDGLGTELSMSDRLAIFNTLRKGDVLESLSRGHAQLYFTPADVNLSIEAHNGN